MGRDGYAIGSVYAMVMRGQGAFKLRYPNSGTHGKHVEFDWSRQVLVLADHGKPYRVYHVSSGKPSTPTVFGSYQLLPQAAGHELARDGLLVVLHRRVRDPWVRVVPNYAASHGCLRVPIPNAVSIYNWIDLGDPIYTYE